MPLKNAPLVEVIFEIRWGERTKDDLNQLSFKFNDEELSFFPGEFRSISKAHGFGTYVSRSGIPANFQPHNPKYQFWSGENTWPCLQLGLGLMTANQVNDGYSWKSFKQLCLTALDILDQAHPLGLQGLPAIGVELRFQDGFPFDKDESPYSFIHEKLNIDLGIPDDFSNSKYFVGESDNHSISFTLPTAKPNGFVQIGLSKGTIWDKEGFIMNTTTRSADGDSPSFEKRELEQWLEDAHDVQRHTFETLIKPAYMSTFK